MNSTEKEISYNIHNSYSTLNTFTSKTKNIWFVCHGMGYLSRYFLKYFKGLAPEENYVIAPQAQSKYYMTPKFKHVGASWLTKENTIMETENIMNYFDAIFDAEMTSQKTNLIVFGYSQGVSVAMRYIAKRQLQCDHLILHSGGIPNELTKNDFAFFKGATSLIYGTDDAYLTEERIHQERMKAEMLFEKQLTIIPFEGIHEVNTQLIKQFA
ncbi:MAG: esterase [Algicola sp.]|nr:esterase [Algicola sp.]